MLQLDDDASGGDLLQHGGAALVVVSGTVRQQPDGSFFQRLWRGSLAELYVGSLAALSMYGSQDPSASGGLLFIGRVASGS